MSDDDLIVLIAPNVSEQLGGEGIKALHIFQELKKLHPRTVQVTHARNREELIDRLDLEDVHFVEESWLDSLMWNSVVFRWFLNWSFSYRAVKLADALARRASPKPGSVIVWQTEPNSPVSPRVLSKNHANCFGPINGNIYYPPIFQRHEKLLPKLRRIFHMPIQRVNRWLFSGITKADLIFCAGGDRTRRSLLAVGCSEKVLVDSLDCGIKDTLMDLPRATHAGENFRFIHFGRLVFHKGTSLIIESLAKTKCPVSLDIVGQGPELERCRQLVDELGLSDRVNFLGWYTSHTELFDSMSRYRGFLLPSLEDANGIVVQEAMAMGLPAICLDWGGPQLLVEHEATGYLVQPDSREHITSEFAKYMDALAVDGALAEEMAIRSRERAQSWQWSQVLHGWHRELDKIRQAGAA